MKILTITLLILSLNAFSKDDCTHTDTSFKCVKYLSNYDGDTVKFDIGGVHPLLGKKIAIRVNGVDTAEMRTKDKCEKSKARTAKKLVANLLKNAKRIDLNNVSRGKYFRIVADIVADGINIGDVLIKNKLAYKYGGGTKNKPNWCNY